MSGRRWPRTESGWREAGAPAQRRDAATESCHLTLPCLCVHLVGKTAGQLGAEEKTRGNEGELALDGLGLWHLIRQPAIHTTCLLYTSPSPRDGLLSRMPSSA